MSTEILPLEQTLKKTHLCTQKHFHYEQKDKIFAFFTAISHGYHGVLNTFFALTFNGLGRRSGS